MICTSSLGTLYKEERSSLAHIIYIHTRTHTRTHSPRARITFYFIQTAAIILLILLSLLSYFDFYYYYNYLRSDYYY